MRTALVCLPWLDTNVPPAGLGALSAYVRAMDPRLEVDLLPEHVEAGVRIGFSLYRLIRSHPFLGEQVYAALVYPDKRPALVERWRGWIRQTIGSEHATAFAETVGEDEKAWDLSLDRLLSELDEHLDGLVDRVRGRYQLVGLTTSFHQLFANVMLSRRLKEADPAIRIVFGGALITGRAGPPLLEEYPDIDFIVQGEGEVPFLALLQQLALGSQPVPEIPGILSRQNFHRYPQGVATSEIDDISKLPPPDYSAFEAQADTHALEWRIWLQSSRGCWWDRSACTGDSKDRCYFCNLNQRQHFSEKAPDQVAGEISHMVERYKNPNISIIDLTIRHRGIGHLAQAIKGLGKELRFQCDARVEFDSAEILSLYEAGLALLNVGIEGFSTAYLSRIGKGTTTIQNLAVLKTCAELEVATAYNLLVGFPGSTSAEVEETEQSIRWYALAYQPPASIFEFNLTLGSTVELHSDAFGIARIRNHAGYRPFLPDDTMSRLVLPFLEWDYRPEGAPADWEPVRRAYRDWLEFHREFRHEKAEGKSDLPKPLYYQDGGTFIEILDRRHGIRRITLTGVWRELYLYCLQIRTVEQVRARFAASFPTTDTAEIIRACVAERLMFCEDSRCLALAPAVRPDIAARRIRSAASRRKAAPV